MARMQRVTLRICCQSDGISARARPSVRWRALLTACATLVAIASVYWIGTGGGGPAGGAPEEAPLRSRLRATQVPSPPSCPPRSMLRGRLCRLVNPIAQPVKYNSFFCVSRPGRTGGSGGLHHRHRLPRAPEHRRTHLGSHLPQALFPPSCLAAAT